MTPLTQIRKEQRTYDDSSAVLATRTWHVPSMAIPPFVLKLLGLKAAS